MATQIAMPPQQIPGQPSGWTHNDLFSIRDKVLRDMHANIPVLTHPLTNTMPRGDQAADELAAALDDIFTVVMDPIAMIITVIPDVLGMKARKIARPKNCFVIYRLDKHADIKALNPDLTNNDCSKVIAQMWRNEPQSVKDEYRSRAEAERRQHAIDHPGYQYQPRKPSEKKKRMTKNKVAKLATSSNTVARNTQVPRQQLPLSRSTFASRVAPPMDLLAAMHTSGNDVDQLGAFPRFKVPKATTPKNLRTAPRTVEQTRQNVLDAENDMNQFFDFTKAIEDLPSNFLPTDAWEAERTTANQ